MCLHPPVIFLVSNCALANNLRFKQGLGPRFFSYQIVNHLHYSLADVNASVPMFTTQVSLRDDRDK